MWCLRQTPTSTQGHQSKGSTGLYIMHPAEVTPSMQFRHMMKDTMTTRRTETDLHLIKKLLFSLITVNPKYEIYD